MDDDACALRRDAHAPRGGRLAPDTRIVGVESLRKRDPAGGVFAVCRGPLAFWPRFFSVKMPL